MDGLPDPDEPFTEEDLRAVWPLLTGEDRMDGFRLVRNRAEAEEFFLSLAPQEQCDLILGFPPPERKAWVRLLDPDDATDLVQAAEPKERGALLDLMDPASRKEVTALLAFAEDDAGGLMNPRFARVRPDMSVDEALRYLQRQARERLETLYYAYVLDTAQHLLGVVSLRELFSAPADRKVSEVMQTDLVSVREEMDQEAVSRVLAQHDLIAVPVVDGENRMKGIVTFDDIVDVVEEEATEDIHRMGGSEALDSPYLRTPLLEMVRKRAGWLLILFLGEMLTASAMGYFEEEIGKAVVLALFIPLIVSSGGNSGSQATTLIIRAMALGEVRIRDWWIVVRRELSAGLLLGGVLGTIGLLRILLWQFASEAATGRGTYGPHYMLVGLTVGISVLGVVTWGTLVGSMLPFLLRRVGFDPASASAPFVATLVDVTGLLIYFSVASSLMTGSLL